jgi:hypothetical protein
LRRARFYGRNDGRSLQLVSCLAVDRTVCVFPSGHDVGAVTALGSGGEKLGSWKLRLQLAGFEELSCMNSIIIPEGIRFVPPLFRRFKGGQ